MGVAVQIICALLIVGAIAFFVYRNKEIWLRATAGQKVLAVFQIILCGLFFSLCVSDLRLFQSLCKLKNTDIRRMNRYVVNRAFRPGLTLPAL